jgi:hypothetical protein
MQCQDKKSCIFHVFVFQASDRKDKFVNAMAKNFEVGRTCCIGLLIGIVLSCVLSIGSIVLNFNPELKNLLWTPSTEARVTAGSRTGISNSTVVEAPLQDINAYLTNISEDLRSLREKTEQLSVTNARQQAIIDDLTKNQTITKVKLENIEVIQKQQLQEKVELERCLNNLQKFADINASNTSAGNRLTKPLNLLLMLFPVYIAYTF